MGEFGFTVSANGALSANQKAMPVEVLTFADYMAVLELLGADPLIAPSLNGNNGEATNSDDVSYIPEIAVGIVTAALLTALAYVISLLPERHRAYRVRVVRHDDGIDFDFYQVRDHADSNHHLVHSDLNGANGEVTGTDDHPTSKAGKGTNEREAGRRRAQKEARNHQHQKPLNCERASGGAPAVSVPKVPVQAGAPDTPAPELPPPEPVAALVDAQPSEVFVTQEGLVLRDGRIRPVGDEATVVPGTVLENVVSIKPGAYTTLEGKGETVVVEPVLAREVIPAFANGVDAFRETEYLVFVPLIRLLRRKLAGKQSANTPAAASSLSQKDWPMVDLQYVLPTIEYFVRQNEYIISAAVKGNSDMRRLLGMPAIVEPLMDNEVYELSLVTGENPVNPGSASRVPAGDCGAPADFQLRTDFVVVKSEGTSWDGCVARTPDLGVNGPMAFETAHSAAPRWYRTEFFKFRTTNGAAFVQYDANGHNAAAGIKRLIGARDDQKALQSAQQTLVSVFTDLLGWGCEHDWLHANYTKVLRTLSTNMSGVTSRHGLILGPIDYEDGVGELPAVCQERGLWEFMETQAAVTRFHLSLISACTRSTMQHVIDESLTLGNYLYQHTFGNLLEFMAPEFQRVSNAAIPHRAQRLRQEYVNGVLTHTDGDIMVLKLEAKVKNETAKDGKASRLYVSYSAGCMFENALPDYLKKCIMGWHVLPTVNGLTGAICVVNCTSSSELDAIFRAVMEASMQPDSYLAVAMSDDMIEMVNFGGTTIAANTDVESNDSSNGAYPFMVYGMCLAGFNVRRACGILQQLMMPIELRNPSNRAEVLSVNMVGPFEGSGTVATTGVNAINSAGTCVATHHYLAYGPRTVDGFVTAIKAGAAVCGHSKSVELCGTSVSERSKIQFLKRSPMRCSHPTAGDDTKMVMNLGCILRNLGQVDGDLTAKHLGVSNLVFSTMTDNERAHRHWSSVVRGLKHHPECPIVQALRTRFNHSEAHDLDIGFKSVEVDQDLSQWVVDVEDICARYECSIAEIDELADLIRKVRVGYSYSCSLLDKIYLVDYGLMARD